MRRHIKKMTTTHPVIFFLFLTAMASLIAINILRTSLSSQEKSEIQPETSQKEHMPSFITFLYPTSKSTLTTKTSETIRWKYSDMHLLNEFPDFDIYFSIYDSDGNSGGVITIAHTSTTSYSWNADKMVSKFPSFYTPSKRFRIKAALRYSGTAPFTCPPRSNNEINCEPLYKEPIQSQIKAAKKYMTESDLFYITSIP